MSTGGQNPHGIGAVLDVTCSRCPRADTYRTEAHCTNCDWRGEALHSKGHLKDDRANARCPRCDTKAVRMGAYLDDEPASSAGSQEPAPAEDPLAVRCPTCGVEPGKRCRRAWDSALPSETHSTRVVEPAPANSKPTPKQSKDLEEPAPAEPRCNETAENLCRDGGDTRFVAPAERDLSKDAANKSTSTSANDRLLVIPDSVYERGHEAYHEHKDSGRPAIVGQLTAYITGAVIRAWEEHRESELQRAKVDADIFRQERDQESRLCEIARSELQRVQGQLDQAREALKEIAPLVEERVPAAFRIAKASEGPAAPKPSADDIREVVEAAGVCAERWRRAGNTIKADWVEAACSRLMALASGVTEKGDGPC